MNQNSLTSDKQAALADPEQASRSGLSSDPLQAQTFMVKISFQATNDQSKEDGVQKLVDLMTSQLKKQSFDEHKLVLLEV